MPVAEIAHLPVCRPDPPEAAVVRGRETVLWRVYNDSASFCNSCYMVFRRAWRCRHSSVRLSSKDLWGLSQMAAESQPFVGVSGPHAAGHGVDAPLAEVFVPSTKVRHETQARSCLLC